MTKPRVALLTEIPAPYRIPLFNALAELVDLRVLFLAERNPDRPYRLHENELRFSWEVLPGRDFTIGNRWIVLNRGVRRRLRDVDAILLGGWNQPAFWLALAGRKPVLAWVESTQHDRRTGAASRAKRLLAARCSAFVVPGAAAAEYVRSIAPVAEVVVAPNAVDGALFSSRVAERIELRSQLELDGCCFLYVGRLAPEKGVDVLVQAFEGVDGQLVLAGAGPEEARLRAIASPAVRFLGNVERDDLPAWYAAADVLVLPSRSEPWGMPLNEAAAAGLPLVATTAVGAARELVEDGVNGFCVPPEDVEALRAALVRVGSDPDFRRAAGERSRELVQALTPEAWATEVRDAIRSTIESE